MAKKGVNRRDFIKQLAGGAVSTAILKLGISSANAQTPPTDSPTGASSPLHLVQTTVIRIRSGRVMSHEGVNRRVLRDMIVSGMIEMTHAPSIASAFKELFSKKDVIGFKFNSSNAGLLRTNIPLAEEFLRLLVGAGYNPASVFFIEVQPSHQTLPETGKVEFGWGEPVDFGSGKDSLAKILDRVTAVVNVGLLKANAIAGMSGCLKNIAYGLIKHPARYHADGCTPYIADIYNLPQIRDKVRLNVLNAMRVLLRSEKFHEQDSIVEDTSLIFGENVVAVDSIGFEILDAYCRQRRLPPLISEGDFPKQLIVAARKGLGVYHPDQIRQKFITVD